MTSDNQADAARLFNQFLSDEKAKRLPHGYDLAELYEHVAQVMTDAGQITDAEDVEAAVIAETVAYLGAG